MSTAPLLTEVDSEWRTELADGLRSIAWSPGGRLVAVDAAGVVLIDRPEQRSTPVGPDPIAATWLGDRRVLVADAAIGVVSVGGGCERLGRVASCLVGSGRTVVAGCADELVVWRVDARDVVTVESRCGRVRAIAPITSTLWAVAGADGVSVVDVALDAADVVVEIPGALTVAAHPGVDFVAASDVSGTVHLIPLGGGVAGAELDGYPDRVRRLGWVAGVTAQLVAVADDELTWWQVSEAAGAADQPVTVVAHESAITALAVDASGMVVSGDAGGGVRLWSPLLPDRPVWAAELGAPVTAVAWSRDGDRMVVGCGDGSLVRFRVFPGSIA